MTASSTVAAFDFDGTLSRRDALVPFLRRVAGPAAVAMVFARHPVLVGRALLGDREPYKAAVLARLLAGRTVVDLEEAGRSHAAELERSGLRDDTLARLRWHQSQGHRTLIVSASLRYYLEPLAASLGVDHVLCTELEVGADGRLTGRLVDGNCRGAAKVARLLAWSGERPTVLWAYGDSTGDRELLAVANHPVLVSGRTRLTPVPAEFV
jgi:phosphatidylglycerophosphatase C